LTFHAMLSDEVTTSDDLTSPTSDLPVSLHQY
jgi:hypothetical protein